MHISRSPFNLGQRNIPNKRYFHHQNLGEFNVCFQSPTLGRSEGKHKRKGFVQICIQIQCAVSYMWLRNISIYHGDKMPFPERHEYLLRKGTAKKEGYFLS